MAVAVRFFHIKSRRKPAHPNTQIIRERSHYSPRKHCSCSATEEKKKLTAVIRAHLHRFPRVTLHNHKLTFADQPKLPSVFEKHSVEGGPNLYPHRKISYTFAYATAIRRRSHLETNHPLRYKNIAMHSAHSISSGAINEEEGREQNCIASSTTTCTKYIGDGLAQCFVR